LFWRVEIQLTAVMIASTSRMLPIASDPYCTLRRENDRAMSRHWLSR
jgi:hypothetical protein